MEFRGQVVRRRVGAGSKSDREAIVLLTPEGALPLRRPGGNPFSDPDLDKLVGHEIAGEGELHAGQLLMRNWHVVG